MVKLSTKIVQMLCDRNIVEPSAEPLHPTRSEIINAIDAVIDLHVYERSELFLGSETDDERSIRIATNGKIAAMVSLPDKGGKRITGVDDHTMAALAYLPMQTRTSHYTAAVSLRIPVGGER